MSYQQYRPTSFNILPVVIKNLIIINTIFWLAGSVFEEQLGFSLNRSLGLYFPLSTLFNPTQYVSHLFLHEDFMHLFFNMIALWMFGVVLENFWGPKKFMIYYFGTGLGAAFIYHLTFWYELHQFSETISLYAASPNIMDFFTLVKKNIYYINQDARQAISIFINKWEMMPENAALISESVNYAWKLMDYKMNIPSIGASGAVFGVLLAFGMLFPNNVINLYFVIPIKAKYFVILYGLFVLYAGFSNNPGDNVAHFAHLGGMLVGYFLIKFWNKYDRKNLY